MNHAQLEKSVKVWFCSRFNDHVIIDFNRLTKLISKRLKIYDNFIKMLR